MNQGARPGAATAPAGTLHVEIGGAEEIRSEANRTLPEGAFGSAGRTTSFCKVTDQLSDSKDLCVLEGEGEVENEEGLSPRSRSLEETYSKGLRSSGRKLTRTVSLGKLVRYGVHSIQNLRPEMEDAHRVVLDVQRESIGGGLSGSSRPEPPVSPALGAAAEALQNFSFFGVFDGHGGSHAAEFSGERLCALLGEESRGLLDDPVEALRNAFARTEEEWLKLAEQDELFDGTTAAVAVLDRQRGRCVVGNVGDCEVLLGTRDLDGVASHQILTEVHHVKRNEREAARVEAVGGRIWRGRLGHPKINPKVVSLAVSRAIGDLFFKGNSYTEGKASGLIADPYVTSVEVIGEEVSEQFLIIGCDGFWDTVSYEEALCKVFELLDAGEDAQTISEKCVHLARDAGSSDNITVMIVVL